MTRLYAFPLLFALAVVIVLAISRPVGAEILISTNFGNSWDALIGANPLFVVPSETKFSAINVRNNPFNTPALTGPVQLSVMCCKDALAGTPVTVSQLTFQVTPFECRPILPANRPPGRPPIGEPPAQPIGIAPPLCPTSLTTTVNVTPTATRNAFLRVMASSNAAPGRFIATIRASSTLGTSTQDIFVSILPASWPTDGPPPACPPPNVVVSLGSINPAPFTWKRSHLASTSYSLGIGLDPLPAGLQLMVGTPGGTGPILPTIAVVTFKNTRGWPVAVRTVDSRSCGSPGQQIVVAQDQTKSISFNATSTTTLVFSKSTCRAWVDWFDCWGQSALGLDDIVTFSEGPFWTLFGGRKVDIETAGDWGAIPRPTSVAIIRSP